VRREISAVDRHDLEVSAWEVSGWIEIRIRNAVGVTVPVQLGPHESLLLVLIPEKREPMTDSEKRGRLLAEANRKVCQRYGIE
jgi:hypothetical protein